MNKSKQAQTPAAEVAATVPGALNPDSPAPVTIVEAEPWETAQEEVHEVQAKPAPDQVLEAAHGDDDLMSLEQHVPPPIVDKPAKTWKRPIGATRPAGRTTSRWNHRKP